MDEAAAGERDDLRLPLAPVRERRRPLAGPPDLVHLLAGEDDAAVDEPGRRSARAPRAVTATIASSSSARPSRTRPSLTSMWPWPCTASANRSRSPKRSPMRGRLAGDRGRRREVAGRLVLEHRAAAAGSRARRTRRLVLEEPLRAAEPAARRADRAAAREVHADPELRSAPHAASRRARGSRWCARSSHAIESSSRPSMKAQIASSSRSSASRPSRSCAQRQCLVRLEPCAARVGLTASPELLDSIRHAAAHCPANDIAGQRTRPPGLTTVRRARLRPAVMPGIESRMYPELVSNRLPELSTPAAAGRNLGSTARFRNATQADSRGHREPLVVGVMRR